MQNKLSHFARMQAFLEQVTSIAVLVALGLVALLLAQLWQPAPPAAFAPGSELPFKLRGTLVLLSFCSPTLGSAVV